MNGSYRHIPAPPLLNFNETDLSWPLLHDDAMFWVYVTLICSHSHWILTPYKSSKLLNYAVPTPTTSVLPLPVCTGRPRPPLSQQCSAPADQHWSAPTTTQPAVFCPCRSAPTTTQPKTRFWIWPWNNAKIVLFAWIWLKKCRHFSNREQKPDN
jgi:hypothetical protein